MSYLPINSRTPEPKALETKMNHPSTDTEIGRRTSKDKVLFSPTYLRIILSFLCPFPSQEKMKELSRLIAINLKQAQKSSYLTEFKSFDEVLEKTYIQISPFPLDSFFNIRLLSQWHRDNFNRCIQKETQEELFSLAQARDTLSKKAATAVSSKFSGWRLGYVFASISIAFAIFSSIAADKSPKGSQEKALLIINSVAFFGFVIFICNSINRPRDLMKKINKIIHRPGPPTLNKDAGRGAAAGSSDEPGSTFDLEMGLHYENDLTKPLLSDDHSDAPHAGMGTGLFTTPYAKVLREMGPPEPALAHSSERAGVSVSFMTNFSGAGAGAGAGTSAGAGESNRP
jgi:hypothetical protein